jgi:hypothetical protein
MQPFSANKDNTDATREHPLLGEGLTAHDGSTSGYRTDICAHEDRANMYQVDKPWSVVHDAKPCRC